MSDNRLIIFDTTMRDGEQSPGASMTKDEKVRIGKALEKLKVDVIEAGFAAASPGEFTSPFALRLSIAISAECLLKTLLFCASVAAFLCLIFDHLLCPDIYKI